MSPSAKRVLVVAPHPDDETLGAGGAIAKYASQGHEVSVLVVSGHLPPLYAREAYDTSVREARQAFAILGVASSQFLEIPATMIGSEPIHVVNQRIAAAIQSAAPQVVLCPFPDRHIDHRLIFESVMVATRPVGAGRGIEMLAAYETLSETHWNAPHIEPTFVPNWVVDISAQIDRKLEALRCYESQIPAFPGARSIEAASALARFRGTQAGFAFGEGFHVIRLIG
jgi:LmbE family N-acetylglucosaminyl deacetylase